MGSSAERHRSLVRSLLDGAFLMGGRVILRRCVPDEGNDSGRHQRLDRFFAGRGLPHVFRLEQFVRDNEDLTLSGVTLTEILQGIRDDAMHRRVRRDLSSFILLPMHENVFVLAADIYRELRKQGTIIRKTNDSITAATALEHRCRLLHNDKDFVSIAKHFPLKIIKP